MYRCVCRSGGVVSVERIGERAKLLFVLLSSLLRKTRRMRGRSGGCLRMWGRVGSELFGGLERRMLSRV
jgi:hypothetical protein